MDNSLIKKVKNGLKKTGITLLAAATIGSTSGCAQYVSRYDNIENRVGYESSYHQENLGDGIRAGLEIIPERVDMFDKTLRIEGYSQEKGENISIYEDVRKSNRTLLREVKESIDRIIEINEISPAGHPLKEVYATGIYDQRQNNDILELETININGELYFTDPSYESRLNNNRGYEFWGDGWWRWYNHAHYPSNLNPWWDPELRGVITYNTNYHDHYGQDWDGDGISNWSEMIAGTNPYNWDTDYDGLSDLVEIWMGTNPRDPDTDNDGYLDGYDPYPRWHNPHHWNHSHHHWDMWWNHNYNHINWHHQYKQRRHRPISKTETRRVPGKTWKTKTFDQKRYKTDLRKSEKSLKTKVERKSYNNSHTKTYKPSTGTVKPRTYDKPKTTKIIPKTTNKRKTYTIPKKQETKKKKTYVTPKKTETQKTKTYTKHKTTQKKTYTKPKTTQKKTYTPQKRSVQPKKTQQQNTQTKQVQKKHR